MTGTESIVHASFGDDGISLPKYVYADASYDLIGVYSNLISSSSPYFFPNLPLHQGVVYIIRRILVRYGTDTGARKYCGQLLSGSRQIPGVETPLILIIHARLAQNFCSALSTSASSNAI